MRVILVGHLRQRVLGDSIFIDVNLRNFAKQLREHEVAVFRLLNVIIRRSAKNIGTIQGRHRLLLFGANDQDDIVDTAHDPLRGEQNRERAGSAGSLGVHGWDTMQFRIDLRQKRTQMELLGELARVEITYRARVDFSRIDLRIFDRFPARFRDQIPDRFALFLQVALKIGSATAENVDRFVHNTASI